MSGVGWLSLLCLSPYISFASVVLENHILGEDCERALKFWLEEPLDVYSLISVGT